ncbi:olfactory receptor 226-like [Rana temporaria]|uniref:olfactory receptor 226-like n=1 Tax=Rana temporaria TaxID=8407 RepID=UPI001AAD126B|nr:olfactory receptor 226-like [Rana temporaria]
MDYNVTIVREFLLLGFAVPPAPGMVLFILILMVYSLSVVINSVIIVLVGSDRRLHKPMYFFISVFSFLELWYPTVTVPGLLQGLLSGGKTVCFGCCVSQFYLHFSLGVTENLLLVVMGFDRYVAFCRPLHYTVIMSPGVCVRFAVGSWIGGFSAFVSHSIQLSRARFCGPAQVDHYYCDFAPLIKLICSDTTNMKTLFSVICCLGGACLLLIMVSYIFILNTILRLPTSTGRHKTFYTCASHLTVVLIFYGTTLFMFARPVDGSDLHTNKIVSVFPSVVTPLLNPIIYSLRNQEVKSALLRAIHGI